MNILEMQNEILKLYDRNEILINSLSRLSDVSLDIAERNKDVCGLSEIKNVIREVYDKLNNQKN